MLNQYSKYYCNAVKTQIHSGKQVDEIDVDFCLTTLKPLHAQWLISLYNRFSSERGAQIVKKRWKRLGIIKVLYATITPPPIDPFTEL